MSKTMVIGVKNSRCFMMSYNFSSVSALKYVVYEMNVPCSSHTEYNIETGIQSVM